MSKQYASKLGRHVEAVQSGTGNAESADSAGYGGNAVTPEPVQQLVEDTPDLTLVNLYDVMVAIARADLHEYPGPKPNWYPSSFGKCDRAAVLERAGRTKNRTSDASALFYWIGNVIHKAVQTAIAKRLPGVVWDEVAVKDEEYHISGKMDNLRMLRMPDESFEVLFEVYEYKTVRTNAFNFKMPYDSHVLQCAIYLTFRARCPDPKRVHGLGEGRVCDVCDGSGSLPLPRRARIAYIGKEDGRTETYTITNSPELRAKVKSKILSLTEQLEKYQKTGEMPPKLPKVQIKVKGVPQVYKRANKKTGVKVGDPKVEDDHRTYNCDYKGQGICCADKEAAPVRDGSPIVNATEESVSGDHPANA